MSVDRSGLENLFWEILRAFEDLALRQYERHVPTLATPAKREFVARLAQRAPDMRTLEASDLADAQFTWFRVGFYDSPYAPREAQRRLAALQRRSA